MEIAQSTATGPNGSAAASGNSGRGVLPAFVTPDWLAKHHHLMKADMRKLAAQMREEYPDWPANADGGNAASFWRAVHALADRWTYFLPLFEERILATFGRVKAVKKQLAPRLLYSVGEWARVLRPLSPGVPEPPAPEDLETLFAAGKHGLVAEAVRVLSCLEGPETRYAVLPWLNEPANNALVGGAVGRVRPGWRPEIAHLVERLVDETAGPHLEKLAARAADECTALDVGIAHAWSAFKTHVADHEEYGPAVAEASYRLLDLDMLADEREEISAARDDALARLRHAALRTLLGGTRRWRFHERACTGSQVSSMSSVIAAGGIGKERQKMSTRAAVSRPTSTRKGALSSRLMVRWKQRSRPHSGARPTASLMNSGSERNSTQSSASS